MTTSTRSVPMIYGTGSTPTARWRTCRHRQIYAPGRGRHDCRFIPNGVLIRFLECLPVRRIERNFMCGHPSAEGCPIPRLRALEGARQPGRAEAKTPVPCAPPNLTEDRATEVLACNLLIVPFRLPAACIQDRVCPGGAIWFHWFSRKLSTWGRRAVPTSCQRPREPCSHSHQSRDRPGGLWVSVVPIYYLVNGRKHSPLNVTSEPLASPAD